MDRFIDLNRKKVAFSFLTNSILFLSFLLIYNYYKGKALDLNTILLLSAGVGLPVLLIAAEWYQWYQKKSIRLKAFTLSPFDKLAEIGFQKHYVFAHSKLLFTEEVKRGEINDFDIICDVDRNSPKQIDFKATTKSRKIPKKEFKELKLTLKTHNIQFVSGTPIKSYNLKSIPYSNITDLDSDLKQFVDLLKDNGFEPLKENGKA